MVTRSKSIMQRRGARLVAAAAAAVALCSSEVHAEGMAFSHGFVPAVRPGLLSHQVENFPLVSSTGLASTCQFSSRICTRVPITAWKTVGRMVPATTARPGGLVGRSMLGLRTASEAAGAVAEPRECIGGILQATCKVAYKPNKSPEWQRASAQTKGRRVAMPSIEDPEVTAMLSKAKEMERKGDREGARGVYKALLESDPDNGKVWMKSFLLCRSAGDVEGGREVLRSALRHLPGNAILWQAWADMEKQLGKHEVARKLYQRGMDANPHLASLYNSWGSMERSLGKIGKARTLFETGLEKDPKSVRLHLSLAILEDVSGNTEAARSILTKGISIEYENAHLHHALGMLEYKRHELGEAREQFRVAVEVDPGFTMAWLSWGRMEEELGNLQLARNKYREGCQTNGGRGSVQLWQAWARLEEKDGEYHSALDAYSKGSALHPRDTAILVEWAKLVERRGDSGIAAKLLKRAISVNSEEAYAFQCLGQLAARQRRWDEARGHFEAGLAVAQRNRGGVNGGKLEATMLHSWAVMEIGLGDMWRARELFTSAMSLGVSEGWLYHWYAKFEAEHGDAWLARHYFARSINACPKDPRPWGDWAALEAAVGNEERAKSYGARASRLSVSKDLASGKVDAERPLGRKWRRNRGRSLNLPDSHR